MDDVVAWVGPRVLGQGRGEGVRDGVAGPVTGDVDAQPVPGGVDLTASARSCRPSGGSAFGTRAWAPSWSSPVGSPARPRR
ncbi:hypothetical protein [Streptomyces albireticuli]|uniref:hypothetical protein n=1 Tax=Streptomyces albireticuli TaxID=1940 RepID=UPI0036B70C13